MKKYTIIFPQKITLKMERFTCFECKELLEYYKFSKTQQKLSRKSNNGRCSRCILENEKNPRLKAHQVCRFPRNLPEIEEKDNLFELMESPLSTKFIAPKVNMEPHKEIKGLYLMSEYPQKTISKILRGLKNVPWKKSLCRSTYSCGWEWVNYGGGKLIGWNNPPTQLAKALSLLPIPPLEETYSFGDKQYSFNQIIFTKYHEHTYQCQRCRLPVPAFNFPRHSNVCLRCSQGHSPTKEAQTCSLYEGMSAHTDRFELGPVVWGITLSGEGFMRFLEHTPGHRILDVPASCGSGYLMTKDSRYKWKHQPYGQDRISMTIRAVPCETPYLGRLGLN